MEIINLEKIQNDFVYEVNQNMDFNISPNSFCNTCVEKKLSFKFMKSSIESKIVYKCVLWKNVDFNLRVALLVENEKVTDVKGDLEIHILNLFEGNQIKIEPYLEIPNDGIKFEHKVTMGIPDERWLEYLNARGMGRMEAVELIVKNFTK